MCLIGFFLREEILIINILHDKQTYLENPIEVSENIETDKNENIKDEINNPQNIYFDSKSYNKLIEYSSYINSKIYPSNWLELNDQLFCPIKYSQTLNSQNTISNGDEILLKLLYKLQFKQNCFDQYNKFLVFDMKTMGTRGLGAVINAGLLKIIYRAIYSNRTLILIGKWQWTKKLKYCLYNNTNIRIRGMNCYMLPTSNCKYNEIIQHFGVNNEYVGHIPLHCTIGDNKTLSKCNETIITINKKDVGWGYFPRPSHMDDWLLYKYRINYNTFRAVCTAFFFRLNSEVRRIVYNKIRNAWIKSMKSSDGNKYISPFNTLSLPIRHSDKCRTKLSPGGEMDCWNENEYISFLNTISNLSNNKINTVIITSESTAFINNLTKLINKNNWRIILNVDDITSELGSSKYIENIENYSNMFNKQLAINLETDPIVGALSSMLLQISNSKYIVHTKSSNWLDLIWALSKHLNCQSIFWSKQFEINYQNFKNQNQNIIILNQKRPKFMYNMNKKYLNFEKYCFEFIQYGVSNKLVYRKSVVYPPDLWENIKRYFKGGKQFEKIFGITPKLYTFCNRYNMPPSQTSDTLY